MSIFNRGTSIIVQEGSDLSVQLAIDAELGAREAEAAAAASATAANADATATAADREAVEAVEARINLGDLDAAVAATAADAVLTAADVVAAQAAQTAAETARDAAFVNANVYADIATGRAAVADGGQFQVVSGDEIIRYRRDTSTTQSEVARYPSAAKITAIEAAIEPASGLVLPDGSEILWKASDFTPLGWYDTGDRLLTGAAERKLLQNIVVPDFYVDSVNGSDANDGLTAETAFATLSALGTLSAGTIVGIAAGSKFRERLTLPEAATVAKVGAGADPIISGADVITGWTLTGGRTNTYQQDVTAGSGTVSTSVFVRAFEDDTTPLVRRTSIDLVESNPGSYFATGTHPNYTVYIHPTGSTNPNTNGLEYEVTTRIHALDAGVTINNVTVQGIQTEKSCHIDGSLVLRGRNNRMIDCTILHGSKHNWLLGSGFVKGGRVAFAEWTGSKTLGVFYLDEPANAYAGMDGHEFDWTLADLSSANNMSGILMHRGGSATTFYQPVVVRNCTARFCSTGFNMGATPLVTYENCETVECGSFCAVGVNTVFNGGLVSSTEPTPRNVVGTFTAGTTLTVGGGFETRLRWTSGAFAPTTTNVTINMDDVFFNGVNKTVTSRAVLATGSNLSLTTRNVNFAGMDLMYNIPATATLDSDFNTAPALIDNIIAGVTYTDFAAYRAGTGQDANSTVI